MTLILVPAVTDDRSVACAIFGSCLMCSTENVMQWATPRASIIVLPEASSPSRSFRTYAIGKMVLSALPCAPRVGEQ